MKKLLMICTYDLGSEMSGIGLRFWELAEVLQDSVKIKILTAKPSDFNHDHILIDTLNEINWKTEIDQADAILFSPLPDTRMILYAHEQGKFILTENAIPIEHLDYSNVLNSPDPDQYYQEIVSQFKLQILLTDYFIARSTVEQATLIACLAMMRRINYNTYSDYPNLSNLISYIPIGFNKNSDKIASSTEPANEKIDYIWNGGIWNYFDAVKIPKAINQLKLENLCSVNCKFMYSPPKNQDIAEYRELKKEILRNNVENEVTFIQDGCTHYERDTYVKAAKAIVCIGKDTIENDTCHRLRIRDVFLYNKPIIVDDFGATAQLVKMYNIGIAVTTLTELKDALYRLKTDQEYYQSLVKNIKDIRSKFFMENHIKGLLKSINHPRKSMDIGSGIHKTMLQNLLSQYPSLLSKLNSPI